MNPIDEQELRKNEIIATLAHIGIPMPEKQLRLIAYVAGMSAGLAIGKLFNANDAFRLQLVITKYVNARVQAIHDIAEKNVEKLG